jgi:MoaA/NifB/PqqE/SkfB family radical SAM enzyme
MVSEGPAEITVSLNSHRAEVHDATRGVTGAYNKAVGALRLLLAERARQGHGPALAGPGAPPPGGCAEAQNRDLAGPRIYAMAVLCELNYRELDQFYDFVLRQVGADKLKLNILQPTFGPPTLWYRDRFFERHSIQDEEELATIIRACDAKYGLRINPAWLDQVLMYLRSVRRNGRGTWGWRGGRGTEQPICNSYERNIMVDLEGRARLCFNPAFPATRLSAPGDLARFWESSDGLRQRMSRCRRYCGISHSVRRESATLPAAVCPGDPASAAAPESAQWQAGRCTRQRMIVAGTPCPQGAPWRSTASTCC